MQFPTKGDGSRLILVRHGETEWNKEGRFQGQIDVPLNKNGIVQASTTREFLKHQKINKAWSSSLIRPIKTANIILEKHPGVHLNKTDGLIEINHGEWEGKLESEIKQVWSDLLRAWKSTPELVQMPNGETIREVWSRSVKSWDEIISNINQSETALVVAQTIWNR